MASRLPGPSLSTSSLQQAEALAQLLWWVVREGQQYNEGLHHARLPEAAVQAAEAQLRTLTYRGTPLLR